MYKIKDYSYEQAKKLGVDIYPSTKKNKKIDVFDDRDRYICSIGDNRYKDYPTFFEEDGSEVANKRRQAYHKRHAKENVFGTPGYYSLHILW